MKLALEHLAADVFGLPLLARTLLSQRPCPDLLPGSLWPRRASDVPPGRSSLDLEDRDALAALLESGLARYEPPVAVLDSARRLREPDAFCVLTEVRPAFLGGTLADVWRVLSAIGLAAELTRHHECPVIPAVWVDAHDEDPKPLARHTFLNEHLELQRISLTGIEACGSFRATTPLEDGRHSLLPLRALLEQLLPQEPALGEAIDLYLPRHGESLADATTRALLETFGSRGLVVLRPEWVQEESSRALAALLSCDTQGALENERERLSLGGEAPPCDPARLPWAVHLAGEPQGPLLPGGDGFRYPGESGSRRASELAAEIVQAPRAWAPGSWLRPVVQESVLPVLVRTVDLSTLPAEAMREALRSAAESPRVGLAPRWSATLVEPETRAACERLGLEARAVVEGSGPADPPARELPPEVLESLRHLARDTRRALLSERGELAQLDAGLAVQLKRTADEARAVILDLRARAERAHKNRSGTQARHRRRVQNALLPRGNPQESLLGPIAFHARWGGGWWEALEAEVEPWTTEHVLARLEAEAF